VPATRSRAASCGFSYGSIGFFGGQLRSTVVLFTAEPLRGLTDLKHLYTAPEVPQQQFVEGLFDVSLEWTPEDGRPQPEGSASPTGPSIYTAIKEQLGLRLEPRTAPLEYVVIEHAARPSEN
jgi:uncharacterized protein (TIGR03435 family)